MQLFPQYVVLVHPMLPEIIYSTSQHGILYSLNRCAWNAELIMGYFIHSALSLVTLLRSLGESMITVGL